MVEVDDLANDREAKAATIERLATGYLAHETLPSLPGADPQTGFRASDVAVDSQTIYLVVPAAGIVSHRFMPAGPCVPQ